MKNKLRFLVALAYLLPLLSAAEEIFVAPDGDDTRDGATRTAAVQTLQRAVDLALAPGRKQRGEATILVAEGSYKRQVVKLEARAINPRRLVITREKDGVRPRFDGEGTAATWLTVSTESGPFQGLQVSGLEITGYATAITLNGSRDMLDRNVSDVLIRNNAFRRIGQYGATQGAPSTAVVRLVNADQVRIVNNRFDGFRNLERCGLIHAVYLAHDSNGNTVEGNHFEDGCGDAIRTRDASSGNRFTGNTFVDAWADAPISDWYCDSSARKDCTKKTPECPSFGNEVADNRIESQRLARPDALKAHGPDATAVCPLPRPQAKDRTRFVNR